VRKAVWVVTFNGSEKRYACENHGRVGCSRRLLGGADKVLSKYEKPADLTLWAQDGALKSCRAKDGRDAPTEVSIGRTDTERALGFEVTVRGKQVAEFVLNRFDA